jgi:hypothetical protein
MIQIPEISYMQHQHLSFITDVISNYTDSVHETDSFLSRWHSAVFYEPQTLLPHSQAAVTMTITGFWGANHIIYQSIQCHISEGSCLVFVRTNTQPYPEPVKSSLHLHTPFNIILPRVLSYLNWSPHVSKWNFVYFNHFSMSYVSQYFGPVNLLLWLPPPPVLLLLLPPPPPPITIIIIIHKSMIYGSHHYFFPAYAQCSPQQLSNTISLDVIF